MPYQTDNFIHLPNPDHPEIAYVDNDVNSQIEEVMTRIKLRAEVLELHTGFSMAAAPLTSGDTQAAKVVNSTPNIKTSRR